MSIFYCGICELHYQHQEDLTSSQSLDVHLVQDHHRDPKQLAPHVAVTLDNFPTASADEESNFRKLPRIDFGSYPSVKKCLLLISAYQSWLCIKERTDRIYGPGYFTRNYDAFLRTLEHDGRLSVKRLINSNKCYVPKCAIPFPTNYVLDHLIPLSKGGPDTIANSFPLCPNHNSSKGAKDLLQWWQEKGFSINALGSDVLRLYSRLMFRTVQTESQEPAPKYLFSFVSKLSSTLPSEAHQQAFLRIGD